jgi:hypothetical protein
MHGTVCQAKESSVVHVQTMDFFLDNVSVSSRVLQKNTKRSFSTASTAKRSMYKIFQTQKMIYLFLTVPSRRMQKTWALFWSRTVPSCPAVMPHVKDQDQGGRILGMHASKDLTLLSGDTEPSALPGFACVKPKTLFRIVDRPPKSAEGAWPSRIFDCVGRTSPEFKPSTHGMSTRHPTRAMLCSAIVGLLQPKEDPQVMRSPRGSRSTEVFFCWPHNFES